MSSGTFRRCATAAVLGTVAVGFVFGAVACRKGGATTIWGPRDSYTYDVHVTSGARLPSGDSSFDMELRGRLAISVLSRTGARVRFAASLDEPAITLGGKQDPEADRLAASLRQPISFELDAGKVVASAFAAGASGITVSTWRTLIGALQLAGGDTRGNSWQAEEWDSAGRYRALYRREAPGLIVRNKESYVDVLKPPSARLPEGLRPRIERSETRYTVEAGLLAAVDQRDVVQTRFDERSSLDVETAVELRLRRDAAPVRHQPEALARTVSLPPDQPAPSLKRDMRAEYDRVLMKDQSFTDVIAALEAQEQKAAQPPEEAESEAEVRARLRERTGAFGTAVAFLRSGQGTVDTAIARIRTGSPASNPLISAMGSAGGPACETGLIEIVEDVKLAPPLRMRAMWTLASTEQPSEAAARALEAHVSEPAVAEQALLGLGSIARRFRDSGRPELAAELIRPLARALDQARTREARVQALRAISNAGDGSLLPRVQPHLGATEPQVRAAAVEALRHMKLPAIDGLIAERMAGDADEGVQLAGLRAAQTRGASPALATALGAVLASGKTPNVRHRAVELAGKWAKDHPQLGDALKRAAQSDPDEKVRAAATSAATKLATGA